MPRLRTFLVVPFFILSAYSPPACPQVTDSLQYAGQVSAPIRTVRYPEVIYPHGILPDWDRGYVLSHGIEKYSDAKAATVVMYDRGGQRIREGHIWPAGAENVEIFRTAATHDGAVVASGGATMADGSINRFLAKTDLSGNTIQTIFTGVFASSQICEAEDRTVWALGREIDEGQPRGDVLRQYSFERGFLRSYLPIESVQARWNSAKPWFNAFGSFLRCGKEKISVYLRFTGEYVEIDAKSGEMKRWKLGLSSSDRNRVSGLAITDDGRVYMTLDRGAFRLFEIRPNASGSNVALLPIQASATLQDEINQQCRRGGESCGHLIRVWGTDGNDLALWFSDMDDVSWVRVAPAEIAAN